MDLAITSKSFGTDKLDWLFTPHGTESALGVTLNGSTFTGTYTDGKIPSGVPVSKITASGLYGLYDDATAGGQDVFVGHLLTPQPCIAVDGATHNVGGAVLLHGFIREAKLPAVWAALGATAIGHAKTDAGSRLIYV